MSLSSDIRKQIINILDDGKEHPISQIKETIRARSDKEISEGVFAGCFRTLLLDKKCESPERGIYVKSNKVVKSTEISESVDDTVEGQSSVADYSKVKRVVDQSVDKMEKDILEVMQLYNLANSDARLITYCLEIRKKFNEFKNEIKAINCNDERYKRK